MTRDEVSAYLIAQEQRLHSREVRGDVSAVAALLSDDFLEFGASGRIWTREEIIEALASETECTITSVDFACRMLSPSLALITYIAETGNRRSLRSSIWRLEGESWRMLFHQGTPIP